MLKYLTLRVFLWMVNQLNKEILEKVDELVKEIEDSPDYQKYLLLKDKISKNKELMELINKVRVLQKDYVHHLTKKEELDKLVDELNSNPLYREYNNTLYEINNIYAIIESKLNKYFQDKLNN